MARYSRKTGARISNEAVDTLGAAIDDLIQQGTATPEALVDLARDPTSAIHAYFEWDDTKAAEQYRRVQARYYLRSITVEYTTEYAGGLEVRAFVPTHVDGGGRVWRPTLEVAATEEGMRELLATAKAELRAFQKKYSQFRVLPMAVRLMGAIDAFLESAE